MPSPPYDAWASDAALLAEIGGALFPQETRVRVRLPRSLAERAVMSWDREDFEGDLPPETLERRVVRHRAGFAALIGLAIEECGQTEGEEVVVELDAWEIGAAFEAADEAGLLSEVKAPATRGPTSR